jgi:hypothetical protein
MRNMHGRHARTHRAATSSGRNAHAPLHPHLVSPDPRTGARIGAACDLAQRGAWRARDAAEGTRRADEARKAAQQRDEEREPGEDEEEEHRRLAPSIEQRRAHHAAVARRKRVVLRGEESRNGATGEARGGEARMRARTAGGGKAHGRVRPASPPRPGYIRSGHADAPVAMRRSASPRAHRTRGGTRRRGRRGGGGGGVRGGSRAAAWPRCAR